MSDLEKIVRPFQTRDISPPRPYVGSTLADPAEEVLLEIGRGGKVKSFQGNGSSSASYYMDAKHKEKAPGGE